MRGQRTRTNARTRKGPAKAYVQDAIDRDGALVWDILRRPDARLVVCGDAKMAQDVEERLLALTPASYTGLADRVVDFLD